jgi:hypothetical protein
MRLVIVCDLPVPGGPSSTKLRPSAAASVAANCELSESSGHERRRAGPPWRRGHPARGSSRSGSNGVPGCSTRCFSTGLDSSASARSRRSSHMRNFVNENGAIQASSSHVPAILVHDGASEAGEDRLHVQAALVLAEVVEAGRVDLELRAQLLEQGRVDPRVLVGDADLAGLACRGPLDRQRDEEDRRASDLRTRAGLAPQQGSEREVDDVGARLLERETRVPPQFEETCVEPVGLEPGVESPCGELLDQEPAEQVVARRRGAGCIPTPLGIRQLRTRTHGERPPTRERILEHAEVGRHQTQRELRLPEVDEAVA